MKISIFFDFWKPFEHSTFHRTLGKKSFTKKVPQNMFKTFLDSLGTILYVFGILNFLNFFENISKTRPSMEHWVKKFFQKNNPKTCSKDVWTFLGTVLGIFGIFKIFWFFENVSKTRPSMEHWAKKIFLISYPKTCSKHVCALLVNIFGHFRNFETFSIFWKHFEDSTLHGTLGKIIFSKKLPQNMFKTRLDILGRILVTFGILKIL